MGILEGNRGHLIVFLFYLGFGLAFLASSIIYLVELGRLSSSLLHPNCTNGILTNVTIDTHDNGTTTGSTTVQCSLFKIWLTIGIVGVVYGSICLLVSAYKLYTICTRHRTSTKRRRINNSYHEEEENPTLDAQETVSLPTPRGTLKEATGAPTVKKAHKHVRRIIAKRKRQLQPQDVENGVSCLSFCGICMEFFIVTALWLISLLMPLYVSWGVISSDAIRVGDEKLYGLSLVLFCVGVVNLTIVAGSSVVMIMEAEDDFEKNDDLEEWERDDPTSTQDWSPDGGGAADEEEPLLPSPSAADRPPNYTM